MHAFDGHVVHAMLETDNEGSWGPLAGPFVGRYGRGMHEAALSVR
jgi:hypothetical protein